jgi:hypothetical protein
MVNETASTRNATSAARNTGSRGSPRIVFAPPLSPLFGILILIATVSTYTQILFRRCARQKGLTPRVTQFRVVRIHITRWCPALSRTLRQSGDFDSRLQSQNSAIRHTTHTHKPKNPSFRQASAARKEKSSPSPPHPASPRHTTPVDECRRCSHCTPASLDEKRPAVHAGLPTSTRQSSYWTSVTAYAASSMPGKPSDSIVDERSPVVWSMV